MDDWNNEKNLQNDINNEFDEQEEATVTVSPEIPQPWETYTEEIPKEAEEIKPAETGKKSGSFFRSAILCLICGILGGIIVLGTQHILTPGKGPSVPAETSGNEEKESGTTVIEKKDVTINVENVTSPATAVAEKVLPSIVGIKVTYTTAISSWFFGTQEAESTGEGSGVIYSEDGYIITNYHVISNTLNNAGEMSGKATIKVFLSSDSENDFDAKIVGYDISSDIAVLKIDKTGLSAIEIGDSDTVLQGDIAIAAGNPGGLKYMGSVSQGIISGLNRTITVEGETYKNVSLIQTDAAINPGNSGGALVDVYGRLIGINSVKLVSDGYEGMGFALPVNYVVSVVDNIIKNQNSVSVFLGIEENKNYTADLLEANGYPGGIVVSSVAEGSPAELAGIEQWDIIVSFNGEAIRTMSDLNNAKLKCAPGDTVIIRVYRASRFAGKYYDFEVTLA